LIRANTYQRLDGTTDLQNRQPMVDSFNRSLPRAKLLLALELEKLVDAAST
jgi:SNF2 family DNA or RNA helicase